LYFHLSGGLSVWGGLLGLTPMNDLQFALLALSFVAVFWSLLFIKEKKR
jgi:hypothetical protein